MSRLAPTSAMLAALAFAAWAPAAGAQDVPVEPPTVDIPQSSAISDQYHEVEEAVEEVLPPAPEPPAEPAPTPEPAPDPAPAADQYHSETPSNVSVTQNQPSNVNVSIRINSPGDVGPVVQINNAGGTTVVEQVVEEISKPAAPKADAPAVGALPDTWEWTWTSACFGGRAARAAAASVPGWSWRWSCDADEEDGGPAAVPDAWPLPDAPGVSGLAGLPGASDALGLADALDPSVAGPARGRERPPAARRRPLTAAGLSGPVGGAPPPAAPGQALVAGAADVAVAASAPVREVVRTVARARSRVPTNLLFPPGDGPVAGASNTLGTVASLLLGGWIAVIVTAVVLVLPRIRRRRWSGPAWRLTHGSSTRLERPG